MSNFETYIVKSCFAGLVYGAPFGSAYGYILWRNDPVESAIVGATLTTLNVAIGWFAGPSYMLIGSCVSFLSVIAYNSGHFDDSRMVKIISENLKYTVEMFRETWRFVMPTKKFRERL